MRMFFEVLKGLIPVIVLAGALTFALAPTTAPVFDGGSVNTNVRG